MNRACKNAERGSAKLTVPASKADSNAGPATFDGRANTHAPSLKNVANKDAGLKGRSPVAGRVP